MGVVLGIAVGLSVVWVLRTVLGEVSKRDRDAREQQLAEHEAQSRLEGALARPGFTPDNPMVLSSAAAIEPRAQAEPCPICDGPLHVQAHEVEDRGPVRLRRLTLKCGNCGRRSTIFARLKSAN